MSLMPVTEVAACCAPLARDPLDSQGAAALAGALRALADPARLRLLSLVAATDDGGACVCDLTEPLGLQQPTVSHHLKILVDAGYLTRERRGTWAYFRIVPGALETAAALLCGVTAAPGRATQPAN